jgi:SAM-dependent methyltransferase
MEAFFILLLAVVLLSAAYAGLSAAPWVPTKKGDIERLLKLARLQPREIVYELGCGDGRVLVKLVQTSGARGVGIEVSILQMLVAKIRAAISHADVSIKWASFFKTNLRDADFVYLFLMPAAYAKIQPKLEAELKPGARVVTYVWPIQGWEAKEVSREEGRLDLYLYER